MIAGRRSALARLAAAAVATLAGTRLASADAPAASLSAGAPPAGVPRVVYHLADVDKVDFVLGNIGNHFKGMGGTDKVHIELVVHGPALAAFKTGKADAELQRRVAKILGQGVGLGACGNTLDAQKLSVAELLPGFARIDEGGVVRLAKLQAQGYAYLRP